MQRPTVVTVFAVLMVIFGGLGVLCTPISLVLTANLGQLPGATGVDLPAWHKTVVFASGGLGILLSLAELAIGIGLLQMQPAARRAAMVLGWLLLLHAVGGAVLSVAMQAPNFGASDPQAAAQAIGAVVGALVGVTVGVLYAGLLLFCLSRPPVKAAFDEPGYDVRTVF